MIFDCLHDLEEIEERILKGQTLLIAGDARLMDKLPAGRWIGGTIPYFMTDFGGICTDKKIFVTDLDTVASNISIKTYDENTIKNVYLDSPENGFSFIIMPAGSKCHFVFSMEAFSFKDFAMRPLIGWISGTHLDERETHKPRIYNGMIPSQHQEGAVVMHVELYNKKSAEVGMLNIFGQGSGDRITFPESGFSTKEAYINGVKVDFAKYILENKLDLRLPLVSNINGTLINTSFHRNFGADGEVRFYAPVFKDEEYRHARPIDNYTEKFSKKLSLDLGVEMIFSCNCILNYVYSGLDRYSGSGLCGPATFGEIAYHIHNQTVVYLRIIHNQ
jgi:hypothetical protein